MWVTFSARWPHVHICTTSVPFRDPSARPKVCPGIIPSRSKERQRREELRAYCLMVLHCYFWVCSSLALPACVGSALLVQSCSACALLLFRRERRRKDAGGKTTGRPLPIARGWGWKGFKHEAESSFGCEGGHV